MADLQGRRIVFSAAKQCSWTHLVEALASVLKPGKTAAQRQINSQQGYGAGGQFASLEVRHYIHTSLLI